MQQQRRQLDMSVSTKGLRAMCKLIRNASETVSLSLTIRVWMDPCTSRYGHK